VPIEIWVSFVVASAALLVIPGPTILTVISYSMAHGRQANIVLVAAVALGDSTALAFSLLGLGAVLATSVFWFTVIKWAGGLYLLFLGISLLRASRSSPAPAVPLVPGPRWKVFVNTYLVTALNPKGVVFFVAFLPQFVDSTSPVRTQLWILAMTFVALAALITTAYAMFAGSARQAFVSPRAQRRFNLVGGTLLSSAGLWALLARRPV
jgi:threonine/homoserine/homoserine lactone efflux protein